MISIKEYARKNNVSYEAIRKQVKRYNDELDGHIIVQNRTQYLDDIAVSILDEHRQESPVIIFNQDIDERIKQLEQENKNLLIKVATQADKIAELSEWKSEHALLIAEANQNKTLLEEKSKQISKVEDELHLEKQRSNQLEKQLEHEKNKGFFARLFKR